MAIQSRRGDYSDFHPDKLLPGEWACVTNSDPDSEDGKSVYMCFEAGVVKRMSTYEDMESDINEATHDIQEELRGGIQQATDDANSAARSANEAAETADQAAENANNAAQTANEAAENVGDSVQGAVNDYFEENPIQLDDPVLDGNTLKFIISTTPSLDNTTLKFIAGSSPSATLEQDVADLKTFARQFDDKTLYTT